MKKIAVVTGGSRGIGFAICKRLAQDGFCLAIMDVNKQEDYAANLLQLGKMGESWLYVKGDICSPQHRQSLVDETLKAFGRIDVLVNNAGVAPLERTDLLEMTEESFNRVLNINTKGTMFLTQCVAKQMIKQDVNGKKRGTIINISSCSSVVSSIGRGEYCVSKAAASMLTTLYADRLAAEAIFVHELRPGVIATDMTSGVKAKYDAMFEAGAFPIARWGTGEDVANAVAAFAGDLFCYTTGNYIDVDGGFHIKRL